jgi:hypothetical protein
VASGRLSGATRLGRWAVASLLRPGCSSPTNRGAQVRAIFTKLALPAAGDDHRRPLAVLTYLMRDQDD